jgi:hypothetical protein
MYIPVANLTAVLCSCLQAIRLNLGSDELQQLLSELEALLDDDAQVGDVGGRGSCTECLRVMTNSVDSLTQGARA